MTEPRALDLLVRSPYFIPKYLQAQAIRRHGKRLDGLVLDIGCGHQVYRDLLGADRYIGLELDARLKPSIVGDACALPVRDASIDNVLCTEVIEHVPQAEVVFREIHRVLRPGGLLLLTAPMSWNLHKVPYDYRRFTSYGLLDLAQWYDFEPLHLERIGGVFTLIGSRLAEVLSDAVYRGVRPVGHLPARLISHLLVSTPLSLVFYGLGWGV